MGYVSMSGVIAVERSKKDIRIIDRLESGIESPILDQSFQYWDDEVEDKKKVFNIDSGFEALEADQHLLSIFRQLQAILDDQNCSVVDKDILSLASGTCWLECWWLRNEAPRKLIAVDFSKHRLHQIAPKMLNHYGLKFPVDLIRGDVSDALDCENTFDIVLLSQAFHHFEDPIGILKTVRRVLNPGAVVILVGEHYFGWKRQLAQTAKHFIKFIFNLNYYRKTHYLLPSYKDLFPPCPVKGDVHYSISDYDFLFRKAGFSEHKRYIDMRSGIQGFCLSAPEK